MIYGARPRDPARDLFHLIPTNELGNPADVARSLRPYQKLGIIEFVFGHSRVTEIRRQSEQLLPLFRDTDARAASTLFATLSDVSASGHLLERPMPPSRSTQAACPTLDASATSIRRPLLTS
jgi:hypothetical protein